MKLHQVALICLFALAVTVTGSVAAEESEVIETFSPPVRVETAMPQYPKENQRMGREGWVKVNMMIDPQGKPYDVTVFESSGNKAFEKETIKTLKKFKYQPAMLNGEPIDAGVQHQITYQLSGKPGASGNFVSHYKRFNKALREENQERASKYLQRMQSYDRNLYEDAFYHLAGFRFAHEYGSENDQYNHLVAATYKHDHLIFLDPATHLALLEARAQIELRLGKLAAARKTATNAIRAYEENTYPALLDEIINAVDSFAASEKVFASKGAVRQDNRYVHHLIKTDFSFDEIDGRIAELRLHCDKGYVGFAFKPDTRFSVQQDWSDCRLIAIGDPGTTFTLLEG